VKDEYSLFKQKRKKGDVWYFWYWDGPRRRNKSTGKILKWQARQEAEKFMAKKKSHKTELTLRQYADPFYVWDRCPYLRRLLDERKTINRRQVGMFSLPELWLIFQKETLGHWKKLQDHTCFLLAAATGMRRGEILALRWRDLDLEDGFIRVECVWKDVAEEGLPKWENRRSVPFLLFKDRIINRLKELREVSI
jgi:integrase